MHFSTRHVFRGIDRARYQDLFFDEAFNEALTRDNKLTRTLEKLTRQGDALERVVRITADREIPGPVAKVIGDSKIAYTERMTYMRNSYVARFHIEPSVLPGKIRCHGEIRFEAHPQGVCRVLDGDLEVKIFGVGGLVERVIVADIERSYARAAQFTQRWIDDGKLSQSA